MFTLYNTVTRAKEEFEPISPPEVGVYTCGPTVYNYAHIGNMRSFVFEDVLVRALKRAGYRVKRVMNITDVGHLVSDADTGEDKMELGARREGRTAWEIAAEYTRAFKEDCAALNVLEPDVWCKATDHIGEMIGLVERLEKNGLTYRIEDGIYFDTARFAGYGDMARLDKEGLRAGARVEMVEGKRSATDFALWKFSPKDQQRQMEWDSPWGVGFPGWHIECSAMSMKYLGEQFDIHCGGIDHVGVHHTNEIAQAEGATGKSPWVKYWCHGEFLVLDKGKMAKSSGEFITVRTVRERGFAPLAYRFFLLQAHYRSQLVFSWEGLEAAANGYRNLLEQVARLKEETKPAAEPPEEYIKRFDAAAFDDMNMPRAMAALFECLKDGSVSAPARLAMALSADEVLGLSLAEAELAGPAEVPAEISELAKKRAEARKKKDFAASDALRDEIAAKGWTIKDKPGGEWEISSSSSSSSSSSDNE
jgi:cysteinyl-tRNA synthetase